MKPTVSRAELGLIAGALVALLIACFGPHLAQYADYHAFADQRRLWGLPFAMDVLSNLPFALFGLWGLAALRKTQPGAQTGLATLFFAGLIATAACSSWYHYAPDNAGLAVDRMGMVLAFAGLLGLATADRVSAAAGQWTAAAVLACGPAAVLVWTQGGNLLPWAVLQGGGMVLLAVLAVRRPVARAWGIPLGAVMAWYALAKLCELGDHAVFHASAGWISGHTLKHCAATMAAFPVIQFMHNGAQTYSRQQVEAAHAAQ